MISEHTEGLGGREMLARLPPTLQTNRLSLARARAEAEKAEERPMLMRIECTELTLLRGKGAVTRAAGTKRHLQSTAVTPPNKNRKPLGLSKMQMPCIAFRSSQTARMILRVQQLQRSVT